MAFTHGSKGKIYMGGWDLSAFMRNLTFANTADVADASVMGNTFKTYVLGLTDTTLSGDGLFDGGTNAIDAILSPLLGQAVDSVWTFLPQGDAVQNRAQGFVGKENSYQVTAGIGDVAAVSMAAQGNTGPENGYALHPLIAEGAGGNSISVDDGAATTNGATAIIQVSAGATLAAKIQHGVGSPATTDLVSFTTTSVRGAERVTVAPGTTINRWIRVLWTGTGTFSVIWIRK